MAFTNEKKTAELVPQLKQKKEKLKGELFLFPGSAVLLNVSCRGAHVSVSVGEAQYAKSQPVTKERIYQQMNKLGNTPYMWEELDIQMGDSVFIPMKVLILQTQNLYLMRQKSLLKMLELMMI